MLVNCCKAEYEYIDGGTASKIKTHKTSLFFEKKCVNEKFIQYHLIIITKSIINQRHIM